MDMVEWHLHKWRLTTEESLLLSSAEEPLPSVLDTAVELHANELRCGVDCSCRDVPSWHLCKQGICFGPALALHSTTVASPLNQASSDERNRQQVLKDSQIDLD